jgi:uncharacterized membrane protein YfcA
LLGRKADWGVVVRFGVPATLSALLGAAVLGLAAGLEPLASYQLNGRVYEVTAVKLVIGAIIVAFALLDLLPRFSKLSFDRKYLPLGGVLSGFFGGLSGNQGALRSAFLIRAGLDKEAFIGTGTVAAVMVDIARLLVYGASFYVLGAVTGGDAGGLVVAATLSAFAGAFLGKRLIGKVTLRSVQLIVGAMLVVVGLGMMAGLL